MTYCQLTPADRYTLSLLRKEGRTAAQIARLLGRHRSTICREIKRNMTETPKGPTYCVSKAQERANGRRRRNRLGRRHAAWQYARVEALLACKWSPEQIAGYLRQQQEFAISHETIYRHVWADWCRGGGLHLHLRQSGKRRRKRYKSLDSRGKLGGKRMIWERPAHVQSRRQQGHWEIDTVMGTGEKDCIVTLVERKTGYVVIGKLKNRTVGSLNGRTLWLMRRTMGEFRSITSDNGTEFHGYRRIEQATGATFYFATPHHSWERGTNENTNGLIRQYLPKGQSMAHVTQRDCSWIAEQLNKRPRKRHGYKTPEERFYGL